MRMASKWELEWECWYGNESECELGTQSCLPLNSSRIVVIVVSMFWICWKLKGSFCCLPITRKCSMLSKMPSTTRFPSFYARKQLLLSAHLSHRNSVCPSVTRVDHSKTVQARITKSSPSAARKTLVSGTVKILHKFEGGHPERGH